MNQYILIQCSPVGSSAYNEENGSFVWTSNDGTRYTHDEAKAKQAELLAPRIAEYQATGRGYKEIYIKPVNEYEFTKYGNMF